MIVSITQFQELAKDVNGNLLGAGSLRRGCQVRTDIGAFPALDPTTRFVRLATNTAIQMDIAGGSTDSNDEYFPAGTVEWIAVRGGETLTITSAT